MELELSAQGSCHEQSDLAPHHAEDAHVVHPHPALRATIVALAHRALTGILALDQRGHGHLPRPAMMGVKTAEASPSF